MQRGSGTYCSGNCRQMPLAKGTRCEARWYQYRERHGQTIESINTPCAWRQATVLMERFEGCYAPGNRAWGGDLTRPHGARARLWFIEETINPSIVEFCARPRATAAPNAIRQLERFQKLPLRGLWSETHRDLWSNRNQPWSQARGA